ncbi:hypothetical protein SALWKB29_1533 [Snodgrassella communis]|jgi:hypothetical protein|uniref:Uncharacterized protein n=1 Tax=Snodgrassella communis TaxID=2946699 RepID=A0A836MQ35_9NEIS|nr:hypothetical protein SALWKB29_1533 [Snodgrassella communis]
MFNILGINENVLSAVMLLKHMGCFRLDSCFCMMGKSGIAGMGIFI